MSTPSNLVIVESPAKAKTIEKFLGPDYRVMSSYGHIRDLKKRNFSIDVDNGFQPVYEIPDDKTQLVSELRKPPPKPTPYGSRPMKTAREKPSHGTCTRFWN